ncbi:MAG: TIGR00266 family protein [Clostridium sp.]
MNYEILHKGNFPIVKCHLEHGEQIKAESDAMISMSPTIDITGTTEGGILKGLARMAAGEKFFFQYLAANRGPGDIIFAHALPGDIIPIELNGTGIKLQKDGFLASTMSVDITTKVQNLSKGLFSGEGFFILGARGTGTIFVSSYGAIHEMNLNPGEEIIIDNSHLVAWDEALEFNIEKASKKGWISSFTSGEGLVCRFTGPGRIFIQTRNPGGMKHWISQMGFKTC